jgi:hypothetical protein
VPKVTERAQVVKSRRPVDGLSGFSGFLRASSFLSTFYGAQSTSESGNWRVLNDAPQLFIRLTYGAAGQAA